MVIDVESRIANLYSRNSRQKLALRTRSLVRGVGFAHQFTSIYKENPPINVTARAAEQPSPLEASSAENVARSARSFTSGRQ